MAGKTGFTIGKSLSRKAFGSAVIYTGFSWGLGIPHPPSALGNTIRGTVRLPRAQGGSCRLHPRLPVGPGPGGLAGLYREGYMAITWRVFQELV